MPQAINLDADGTMRLRDADTRHVWHPFTQMQEYLEQPPLLIASGRGGWLTDTEGRSYLDGTASIWTNVHGHADPDLNEAIRHQLDQMAHSTMLGASHPVGVELAKVLAEIAPAGLSRVFFSDNGAGAVEVALKLSFQYWQLTGRSQKRRVIGMAGGYHGDTFGAMAAGDSAFFHERFRPWCFSTTHFPAPRCRECAGVTVEADATDSLSALRRLLEAEAAYTACVIIEPSVQGASGMRLQPAGFVSAVASLCREYGVHLILDEVFVAFGRVGPLCVAAAENVQPDFICFAKGLTGGYLPLAATMVREEIFHAFFGSYESGRAFFHGHTFTGNPLGAAVALATIRKLQPLIEQGILAQRAAYFGRRLQEEFSNCRHLVDARQRGFAAALEFRRGDDGATARPAIRKICEAARRHGVMLRPLGDILPLVPPLCLSESEINTLIATTAEAVTEVCGD